MLAAKVSEDPTAEAVIEVDGRYVLDDCQPRLIVRPSEPLPKATPIDPVAASPTDAAAAIVRSSRGRSGSDSFTREYRGAVNTVAARTNVAARASISPSHHRRR